MCQFTQNSSIYPYISDDLEISDERCLRVWFRGRVLLGSGGGGLRAGGSIHVCLHHLIKVIVLSTRPGLCGVCVWIHYSVLYTF